MTDQEKADFALSERADFAAIASWIQPEATVLDLGCADGLLLRYLSRVSKVRG